MKIIPYFDRNQQRFTQMLIVLQTPRFRETILAILSDSLRIESNPNTIIISKLKHAHKLITKLKQAIQVLTLK